MREKQWRAKNLCVKHASCPIPIKFLPFLILSLILQVAVDSSPAGELQRHD